jgi:Acyl-CoA reductase (LuxC)
MLSDRSRVSSEPPGAARGPTAWCSRSHLGRPPSSRLRLSQPVTQRRLAFERIDANGLRGDVHVSNSVVQRVAAGAQRLCRLGTANAHALGSPHDAMYPLQRLVHWMADDDIALNHP